MFNTYIVAPMINALLKIYEILGAGPHTFGFAIIIFTALVRLLTLPLTYQQMRSSLVMQELQQSDRWKKIQKKYEKDRQKLAEEQMKLYQEAGTNPFSGCLGLLIQFPIIIGLYQSIIRTMASTPVQLLDLSKMIYSGISSSLIPLNSTFLWMNLGQPERWDLAFIPDSIPILGEGIPVLTILVVISTWFQTKLTTPTTQDSQAAGMTQMMTLYMPLLLGYFAYTLASGLALYFVASNLLGILQGVVMRSLRDRESSKISNKKSS
jgi:YidC/Oxa1 family membrane protein insertase